MDAAGPWKAMDVFEEQQEHTRPHLPTALGKPADDRRFPPAPTGRQNRQIVNDGLASEVESH
jgi:CHAD domain-containing protein